MLRFVVSLIAAFAPSAVQAMEVDLELVLAVDISRSMSHLDLAVQRKGYAEALADPDVMAAIQGGLLGRIGLSYVEWSDTEYHRVIVDWTPIETPDDAAAIATLIVRETGGSTRVTSISSGLLFAAEHFEDSPFTSYRQVIDVSGDGPNNDGLPVVPARDAVVAKGITINGLPLMVGRPGDKWFLPDLDAYYRDCVIGGPGAFVVPVFGWEEFGEAIRRKLVLEIAGAQPIAPRATLHQASGYDCLIGEKIRDGSRSP